MKKKKTGIILVIDRIESGFAFLQFSEGMTVPWPADKLPQSCTEGDIVKVTLEISQEIKKQRKNGIKKMHRGKTE